MSSNSTTVSNQGKIYDDTDYIQLIQEICEQDRSGRHTTIAKGSYGIIIDESNISSIWDITPKQEEKIKSMLQYAQAHDCVVALIAGYPCWVKRGGFIRKKPAIPSLVPWEII